MKDAQVLFARTADDTSVLRERERERERVKEREREGWRV
jgi:hypothetical protein